MHMKLFVKLQRTMDVDLNFDSVYLFIHSKFVKHPLKSEASCINDSTHLEIYDVMLFTSRCSGFPTNILLPVDTSDIVSLILAQI